VRADLHKDECINTCLPRSRPQSNETDIDEICITSLVVRGSEKLKEVGAARSSEALKLVSSALSLLEKEQIRQELEKDQTHA